MPASATPSPEGVNGKIESKDATSDEVTSMAEMVEAAVRAGALGFSTSRIQAHRSMSGYCVPGTWAPESELAAIAHALNRGGGAVFQAVAASGVGNQPAMGMPPEHASLVEEVRMFGRLSRAAGVPVTFTLFSVRDRPEGFREALG